MPEKIVSLLILEKGYFQILANIFIITYLRSDLMLEINTQEQLMIVRLKADLDMTGAKVF